MSSPLPLQICCNRLKVENEYWKNINKNIYNKKIFYVNYKQDSINSNTYSGIITYSPNCIYCNNPQSQSLMNDRDGGAFRQCLRCRKNFKANVITEPVNNFSYSTHHLKGTN